jgi:hypothetical protein
MGILDFLFGKSTPKVDYEEKMNQELAEVTFKSSHKWSSVDAMLEQSKEQHRRMNRTMEEQMEQQIAEFFRDILQTEFSEYELSEKVAVTELAGDANDSFKLYKTRPHQAYKAEWGEPYTFVLRRNGEVKGVVMLGDKRSHTERVKYLISRMYAKKLDIPYIAFYTHLPNEIAYVVLRIRKMLKE